MARNGHLALVYREFEKYGITNHRLEEDRGKHNRLSWSFRGISNMLTVPKTPSDFRVPLNILRDFRQQLKAANLTPVAAQPKRGHLQLVSAKPIADVLEKRVAGLVADVDSLTDLVLDIAPDLSRFAQIAEQADAVAQGAPVKFRIQTEVPPALIGSLLAYLIANGVAMRDVRISPLKVAAPEIPAREPAFIQAAPVVAPAPPSEKAPFPICEMPTVTPKPALAPAPKKSSRPGRPFAGSAICKLMQYLRDNGAQTTAQLGAAGFTGYAGRTDRLGAFAWSVAQRGFVIDKPDGSWAITIEGKAKLKTERL